MNPVHPPATSASRALSEGFRQVFRLLRIRALLAGIAWGAMPGVVAGWIVAMGVQEVGVRFALISLGGLALGSGLGGLLAQRRHRTRVSKAGGSDVTAAVWLEDQIPESRNLLRSVAELPVPARELGVGPVLVEEAWRRLQPHPVSALVPLARRRNSTVLLLLFLASTSVGVGSLLSIRGEAGARTAPFSPVPPKVDVGMDPEVSSGPWALTFEVTPPSWTGEPPARHGEGERVEGLVGSRVDLRIEPVIPFVRPRVVTGAGVLPLVRDDAGWSGSFPLAPGEDVLLLEGEGVEALSVNDASPTSAPASLSGLARLVILEGREDPLPALRIVAPGADLFLPDLDRTLPLQVEARHHRSLEALELVFTRVTGFGERWDFEQGEVPLLVEREADGVWTARAAWDLSTLELGRGESVVYQARARDARPDAPWGESDRWTLEVIGGAAASVGGFAGDDETTRYALSQQMVVALTERLLSAADTLSEDARIAEARVLSAAQRRVRAEFVFMLGGELDDGHHHGDPSDPDAHDHDHDHAHGHAHAHDPVDPADAPPPGGRTAQELHEEAHARADADAAEGRLAQEGRIELARAIQWMARAVTFLESGMLAPALEAEQTALEHLRAAFSSSRYILRALPERERPDPSRRLSGDRTGAQGVALSSPEGIPDPTLAELRRLLGALQAPEASVQGPRLAAGLLALPGLSPELREGALALARGTLSPDALALRVAQGLSEMGEGTRATPSLPIAPRGLAGAWSQVDLPPPPPGGG